MRTALVDIKFNLAPAERDAATQTVAGLGWSNPGGHPSPALLARAGDDAELHRLDAAALSEPPAELVSALKAADRVLVSAPPVYRAAVEGFAAALGRAVELVDPWEGTADALPNFALAAGECTAQSEADVLPMPDPAHPWVCPAATYGDVADWEARLLTAVASLGGVEESDVYLADDRIPTTMERLIGLARIVQTGIADHDTLPRFHLRLWPADLMADDRLADHLTLLPLASLELLAGSLIAADAHGLRRASPPEEVQAAIERIQTAGLSYLTGLSIVLALPGQSAEDCIEAVNDTVRAAAGAGIRRVRFALWLGGGLPPRDAEEQHRRFLNSHPDWHPVEYRGLFDLTALVGAAIPQMELIGPGLLPDWAPAPIE